MLRSTRIVAAFLVACLGAGTVQAALASLGWQGPELDWQQHLLTDIGVAATQSCVFAAPFAVVALAIGEWQGVSSWLYYALVGIAIAAGGLLAQHAGETYGEPTIVNPYAVATFLASGLAGGLVYRLLAGARCVSRPLAAPNATPAA